MTRMLFTGLCLAMLPMLSLAQDDKTTTVVKSGPLEMKAADERPNSVIILMPAAATGDFDAVPAHPECTGKKGQESLDCTAALVQALIVEKLEAPTLDMEQWGSSVVGIRFTINQFGEVKDIRVDHSGDRELSQQVILALYDLPKFNAAAKDGQAVNSTMEVNFRYEDLFNK